MKEILDMTCGGRMIWYQPKNSNVEFADNREGDWIATVTNGEHWSVKDEIFKKTFWSFGQLMRKTNETYYLRIN